jgi:hypothetical protein
MAATRVTICSEAGFDWHWAKVWIDRLDGSDTSCVIERMLGKQ